MGLYFCLATAPPNRTPVGSGQWMERAAGGAGGSVFHSGGTSRPRVWAFPPAAPAAVLVSAGRSHRCSSGNLMLLFHG